MPPRTPAPARAGRGAALTIDLVLLTLLDGALAVLVRRAPGGGSTLPWAAAAAGTVLDAAARAAAREAMGRDAAWLVQAGVWDATRRHPSGAGWSVGYVGVVPAGTEAPTGTRWVPIDGAGALPPRPRAILDGAVEALRVRMDSAPVAFRLLPATFTLSDLQQAYEVLLGRPLHKASFRRALQAAWLVEPTDEWRSEGRGRPAQLFRYAPRRRRPGARAVRFDLLG